MKGARHPTYRLGRGLDVRLVDRLRAPANGRSEPSESLGQRAHGVSLELVYARDAALLTTAPRRRRHPAPESTVLAALR